MGKLKNTDFHICFVDEQGSCRSLIRNWVEIDGYVEIVYQEYKDGKWEDYAVTPAYSKDDIDSLIEALELAKGTFL